MSTAVLYLKLMRDLSTLSWVSQAPMFNVRREILTLRSGAPPTRFERTARYWIGDHRANVAQRRDANDYPQHDALRSHPFRQLVEEGKEATLYRPEAAPEQNRRGELELHKIGNFLQKVW